MPSHAKRLTDWMIPRKTRDESERYTSTNVTRTFRTVPYVDGVCRESGLQSLDPINVNDSNNNNNNETDSHRIDIQHNEACHPNSFPLVSSSKVAGSWGLTQFCQQEATKFYVMEQTKSGALLPFEKKDQLPDLPVRWGVFQYVETEEVEQVIPLMAQKAKYIYFSVPTDVELLLQKNEVKFFDRYAIWRERDYYYDLLKNDFAFVSTRVLESKQFFDNKKSLFTEDLFRF